MAPRSHLLCGLWAGLNISVLGVVRHSGPTVRMSVLRIDESCNETVRAFSRRSVESQLSGSRAMFGNVR